MSTSISSKRIPVFREGISRPGGRGFWHVPTAGEMDVYAAADDAVEIRLDGAVILQRNADVGLATEVTTLLLTAGSHAIEVAYEQLGGNSSLNLGWAPAGEARRPFDVAPLFPYGPNVTEVGLSEWSVRLRQLAGAMWHWIPLFLAGMLLCFPDIDSSHPGDTPRGAWDPVALRDRGTICVG